MKLIRLNLGSGIISIPNFINIDEVDGWKFEDGLPFIKDGWVEAITISHALTYVDEKEYPAIFSEFNRVLRIGGVVRITDNTPENPFPGILTILSTEKLSKYLEEAGFQVKVCNKRHTHFKHPNIIQAHHGEGVFFIEGIKL